MSEAHTNRRLLVAVASLAAAALLLESGLTRLMAVAQHYHFAFLVVSLALLGFSASGTFLSLRRSPFLVERALPIAGLAFAGSTALAYAVVNWLPFDSYSIAWERRQLLYFAVYYLVLALPFCCCGLGIGAALARADGHNHLTYAANLGGSGLGALLAPAALALAGVPGAVLASALIGLIPAVVLPLGANHGTRKAARWALAAGLVAGIAGLGILAVLDLQGRAPLGLVVSPYKGLSQALRYPGSTTAFGRWNAISRVDVVTDAGTRLLPGLSYTYAGGLPLQVGLSQDADSLQPISLVQPESFPAASYLPESIAFRLRPGAPALVLEPGGGLGVLQALATTPRVTAVIGNPLVRDAVARTAQAYDVYANPRVRTIIESPRVFLRRNREEYGLVFLPLTDAYRPVTSGAYSLGETYALTVEGFAGAIDRLSPDGIMVVTRWLQTPPSESVRLFATIVEALERDGIAEPADSLVAFRGIQTITVMIQPRGWAPEELAEVREFATSRRYDLVWAPDVREDEVNRFNRLPQPADYQALKQLLSAPNRNDFYAAYPFDIAPARDDHPFFFHFFKWQQAPEVIATLGRTWQPFGGSGYFVLWVLLVLVLGITALLVLTPLVLRRSELLRPDGGRRRAFRALAYFSLIGVAFLFVEIPLIQRWILLLGHPTYAFTAVVFSLLVFSSIGSASARAAWLPRKRAFGILVLLAFLTPLAIVRLADAALGWPLGARVLIAVAGLAPLGFLMGLPFPLGLAWLEGRSARLIPWAWAVNGAASVTAAVLAAILTLSFGFTVVLFVGAGSYAAAGVVLFGGKPEK